jgi:putative nucleotidyltransferase with HDIG domain
VGVPVRLSGGQLGVYCIYRDLTEERAAREELRKALKTMEQAWEQTIEALASTSEVKDPYTAGHQKRVADLAAAIARKMGHEESFVTGVEKAALVHDLGKIEVPAELLSRPGRLSPFEFRLVQMHAEAGFRILSKIHLPWPLAEIVYQHHERLDGSGYPRGLKGEEILPEARILAVADIVEAISSHRPYRPARSVEEALETIRGECGKTLDPEAVKTCLWLFREKGYSFPGQPVT